MAWNAYILEGLLSQKLLPEVYMHVPLLRNIAKTMQEIGTGKRQHIVNLTFLVKQALAILQYRSHSIQETILLKVSKNSLLPTRTEWEKAGIFIYKEDP